MADIYNSYEESIDHVWGIFKAYITEQSKPAAAEQYANWLVSQHPEQHAMEEFSNIDPLLAVALKKALHKI
jgi:hypothetical protein